MSSSSVEADRIRLGLQQISRHFNHPRFQQSVQRTAGIALDKVSEILLRCLDGTAGAEPRMSDVATRLGVELSSVSRKVQKLEEAGLVARQPDPDDGRASRLQPTQAAVDLLESLDRARAEFIASVLSDWDEVDRRHFADLLDRFMADISDHNDR